MRFYGLTLLFFLACPYLVLGLTLEDSEAYVRAVYNIFLEKGAIKSDYHVLCDTGNKNDGVGDIIISEPYCASGKGRYIKKRVFITTSMPPGLRSNKEETLPSNHRQIEFEECTQCQDDDTSESPGYLGVAVSSPCCGSSFSTFHFLMEEKKIIQCDAADMVVSSQKVEKSFSKSCALQLYDERFQPHRGVSFPIALLFCNAPVSEITSEKDGRLLTTIITASISTAPASELLLPREVIQNIVSWIAAEPDSELSIWEKGMCKWVKVSNMEGQNLYMYSKTVKEFISCKIHPLLKDKLPKLELSVRSCSLDALTSSPKARVSAVELNLSRLVSPDLKLQIWSSGSITEDVESGGVPVQPAAVIGAMFLPPEGILTLTRCLRRDFTAYHGLPVLILNPGRTVEEMETLSAGCAAPKSCPSNTMYFSGLNQCGDSPDCGMILSHRYNTNEMKCEPNFILVGTLTLLGALLLACDTAVLLLRWKVEKMMRLVADTTTQK